MRHLCCLCVHFAAQQSIFFHSKLFPLLSQLATAFPILSLFIQSAVRLNLLLLLWLLEWTRDSMQQVAETPTFDWACLRRVLNFRNTGHIEDSFRVKISWADSWCASLQTPTSSSHIQRETYTLESLLPPALLSPLFPAPFLSFSLKLLYHTSQPTLSSTCSTLLAHASSPLYHILHCALLEVPETLHLLYVSSLQPHSSSRMPFVHTHGFRLAAFSSVNLHLSRLPPHPIPAVPAEGAETVVGKHHSPLRFLSDSHLSPSVANTKLTNNWLLIHSIIVLQKEEWYTLSIKLNVMRTHICIFTELCK